MYTEPHDKLLGKMTVPMDKALLALELLIEGVSVRSTERITGLHRDITLRLLVHAGKKGQALIDRKVMNGYERRRQRRSVR